MDQSIRRIYRQLQIRGFVLKDFELLPHERQMATIKDIIKRHKFNPAYLDDLSEHSAPNLRASTALRHNQTKMGKGKNSPDTIAKQIENELSTYEMRSRYRFDFERGYIFDIKTLERVDLLHYFKQHTYSETPYRQVQISIRGLTGKLSAHRMIWAAYHNRWPHPGLVVDHLNRNRLDNRIENLQEVTQRENMTRAGLF